MALNERLTSTTSKRTLSMRKFSAIPNVTGREMQPRGVTDTGPTPENGRDGWSLPISIYSFLKAARLMRLKDVPPSIKTWYSLTLEMVGETSSGSWPALAMLSRQSEESNPIRVSTHLRCGAAFGVGAAAATSRRSLDDTPRGDGPGTSKHDVERLAALVVTGLRVGVAIDGLQCPLGILKLHICVFLLLGVQLLLALLLAGRRTILALLLHHFVELFRELLDLPALRCVCRLSARHGPHPPL
jgi:hypothetical protein